MSTIVWGTGFEGGVLGAANTTTSAMFGALLNATVVANPTTRVNGVGAYSCQVSPSASLGYIQINSPSPVPTSQVRVTRFYFYVTAYPSSRAPFMEFGGATNNAKFYFDSTGVEMRYSNTGTTQLFQVGGVTTVFALNTWYCIDIRVDYSISPKTVQVQVNGVPQVSSLSGTTTFTGLAETASNLTYCTIGTGDAATYNVFYDDIQMSNTLADYPLGPSNGYTILTPTALDAANASVDFSYTTGGTTLAVTTANQATALSTIQDTRPFTDVASYLSQTTAAATAYLTTTFGNPSAGVSARHVVLFVNSTSSTTSASANSAKGIAGGTTTIVYNGTTIASTSIIVKGGTLTVPAGGWTNSNLQAMTAQWGLASTITAVPRADMMWLEYDIVSTILPPKRRVGKFVYQNRKGGDHD